MSEDVLDRIQSDLRIMQSALRLQLPFGKGILAFDLSLVLAALCAVFFSVMVRSDWHQQVPFVMIMVLLPVGLYFPSRRMNHEVNMQVVMSMVVYAVVWVAASGYMLAGFAGAALGTIRTTLLYSLSVFMVTAFTLLLVRAALKSKAQYYCLGLALSTMFAGMLLPILGSQYSYAVAHSCMAVGFFAGFLIQWLQLREVAPSHAAD